MKIWAQLKMGEKDAILALYNNHYIGLINYGLKLTGNRELTNDCITQVLLRLWDKRNDLPVVENVRYYLLTCLKRELFSELKSQRKRNEIHLHMEDNYNDLEQSYEENVIQVQSNKLDKNKLAKGLEKLTFREKELLQLKFYEDLNYDEIAQKCGITKRTAYNIIYTALKSLKANFAENFESTDYNSALYF